MSFSLDQFPGERKLANVIPVFKNDNRQLKVNSVNGLNPGETCNSVV